MNNSPRALCFAIAQQIQHGTSSDVIAAINNARSVLTGVNWIRDLAKLEQIVLDGFPRFNIFAKQGNSKLPFVAFSTLPVVTCPGAGECAKWCYSLTAWRYPAAFCKQAQNAWLMRNNKTAIVRAWCDLFSVKKLADGFDFRLYVDGDFSCAADLTFWMDLLASEPTVRAYGYSKSFALFLQYDQQRTWPQNYMVNLSSGHNADQVTAALFEALPVVRGSFVAVNVGYPVKASHYGDKEHAKALRNAYGANAFVCPGKCGECTPKGHACGSDKFRNVPIIIAVH